MSHRTLILLVSLVGSGCVNKAEEPALQITFNEIVSLARGTDSDHSYDSVVYDATETQIAKISDVAELGLLYMAFRKYDHREAHDGRCALCERLGNAAECCLDRLDYLGSDEAVKELVTLRANEDLLWDGGVSLMMSHRITKFGIKALPYLEPLESTQDWAKLCADYVRRGEIYGP